VDTKLVYSFYKIYIHQHWNSWPSCSTRITYNNITVYVMPTAARGDS